MGSKEDRRKELEDELAALDADDDDSDEVTISHKGQSFTGTWRRALQVAESWGITLVAPPKPDPAKGSGKDKTDDTVRRFSGRRIS